MSTHTSDTAQATVNADQAELDKFGALASRWWDPESEFKPLHAINPLRLEWIQESVGSLAGKKVLDVGCGGGILSEAMARSGAQVTGIDLADKSLKIAKLHGLESGVKVEYRKVPVEQLAAEQPGQYDVVTCMEMLEHVPDPASIVRACAALTKPGGWVFFSTLNRNPKSFLFAIIGAEYVLRLLPRGTHTYDMFIKPSELAAAARGAGLEPVGMRGMEYNPITQIYSLTSDTSVNYLMATRK
ncbi:bifunctional 2-polyprenyl-6-hydroxyphenol methylase/3-demethylubiquinol 3-O-methyltransferase UbiG [Achromobacter xylosoxidans]|jgi:2-polyprenyl-6-hydroxyphenyl methylase/3-demethylubiquinone-9 3-methyltransferase|uniref:Ubiquinone biosynthesis O-methyltransferase n=1 Tax=Alcaligenes xylosoxydans xylosoxydans TaxID=85698 RepID=A0A0D6GRK9_ALCXX|nr:MULTISPECIES: bifunctional 2-polyprenyl-6-hydroxyphenol methylase/3-demethylubiquinol 3-O-methyltransferase UbiG [Achromobacter]AHC46074.1 3-demethylubiquinone-9 3-methyltransferase [Achromobacter xylosoxidans NBRC 15126 = ATCC 27061]AUZ19728.1 bifunctional 2-polyprenyl-6-hydroxyphenol methylase/3-demethylubiquinol 3-O-methyltransferase UbiG [Achromobacter xylosoxidans]AXA76339.1 bifunctional 2-polyprenyl-6-hydroxyphenol methylase/3-demethylubiquinol 3-O-methyltransferase UbiG [Achromobacter 